MKRQAMNQLEAWKQNPTRKPLILMGARQVGKTTLLKQFADMAYKQKVYLNFESEPQLKQLFESSLNPSALIKAIEIEKGIKIVPKDTLLIFDEVQECPHALNSLKYFCESGREYDICAAGSLLGVKLVHVKGFPVGKVDFLNLYPLSFFEFLMALDEQLLRQYLEEIMRIEPILANLHEKLLGYLKLYLFVGGMPEAVSRYIEFQDLTKVREVQQSILRAYSLDFAKHAPTQYLMKINLVWDSIPSQLAKENKKFIYSVMRKGARASEFEAAIQWLAEAGLIYKITHITTPKLPLEAYANFDFFKIYLVDIGLLSAMTNLSPKVMLQGDKLFQEFKGALVENFVVEALNPTGKLYYWTSEGKAEIDFVFQCEDKIFPLEVKSGRTDKKKSLQVYGEKFSPSLMIRVSPMNLKIDGQLLNCPLYLVGLLKKLLGMVDFLATGQK